MSQLRDKGLISFSNNFELQFSGPIDGRDRVKTYAALTTPETWLANDGSDYVYAGMMTVVYADTDPTKNGLYILNALPITEEANWIKVGSDGGVSGPAIATQEEYDAGTATDLVPSVAQVSTDMDALELSITDVEAAVATKQNTLTAGTGISLETDTISVDATAIMPTEEEWTEGTSVTTVPNVLQVKTDLASKADLVGGKIPASQLPDAVSEIVEAATSADFPETGVSTVIYVALDTNLAYRWGGTQYVEISPSVALGETESTAFRGDHGKIAYDTALANQTALAGKQDVLTAGANITIKDGVISATGGGTAQVEGNFVQPVLTANDSSTIMQVSSEDLEGSTADLWKAFDGDTTSYCLLADTAPFGYIFNMTFESYLTLKSISFTTSKVDGTSTREINGVTITDVESGTEIYTSSSFDVYNGTLTIDLVDNTIKSKVIQVNLVNSTFNPDSGLEFRLNEVKVEGLSLVDAPSQEFTYTNLEPSVIEVGGIEAGTTFDNMPIEDILDMLLYPELFPTLTAPSFTFTENAPSLVEVHAPVNITFTTTFNRGRINPDYETNGFRAGLPNAYTYTGPSLPTTPVESTAMTDVQTVTGFIPSEAGTTSWTATVSHDAGEQPLSSKGNNYNTPLAADTLDAKTVSLTAVYPYFANATDIEVVAKQALTNGAYFEVDFVGETDTVKQTIEYVNATGNELSGIEVFNTISKAWEWLGGTRAGSMATFTETAVEKDINGTMVNYRKFTNTTDKIGGRELRFYI